MHFYLQCIFWLILLMYLSLFPFYLNLSPRSTELLSGYAGGATAAAVAPSSVLASSPRSFQPHWETRSGPIRWDGRCKSEKTHLEKPSPCSATAKRHIRSDLRSESTRAWITPINETLSDKAIFSSFSRSSMLRWPMAPIWSSYIVKFTIHGYYTNFDCSINRHKWVDGVKWDPTRKWS